MDQRDLARQVEGDLSPLFADLTAKTAEAASRAFPTFELTAPAPQRRRAPAPKRRSRAPAALLLGVTLAGVAGVAALMAPWPMHRGPSAPVATAPLQPQSQWVAPVPIARPKEPAQLEATTRAAPEPGPGIGPAPAPAAVLPKRAEAAQLAPREPVSTPAVVETAARTPAPEPDAGEFVPDIPRPPPCTDGGEACKDVAEADRLLFYAYRQAWLAKVPPSRLRAVQRSWRPGAGIAVDGSNRALLDAYDVRTRSVWALIDRWERERRP